MPWYQPSASPPYPPGYHTRGGPDDPGRHRDGSSIYDDELDRRAGDGRRRGRNRRGDRDDPGDGDDGDGGGGGGGGDDLQRRLESLLSPMMTSAELESARRSGDADGREAAPAVCSATAATTAPAPYGRSAYPHPSFRHREEDMRSPPMTGEGGADSAAYFFYPHHIPGGRSFHSPMGEDAVAAAAAEPQREEVEEEEEDDPYRDSSLYASRYDAGIDGGGYGPRHPPGGGDRDRAQAAGPLCGEVDWEASQRRGSRRPVPPSGPHGPERYQGQYEIRHGGGGGGDGDGGDDTEARHPPDGKIYREPSQDGSLRASASESQNPEPPQGPSSIVSRNPFEAFAAGRSGGAAPGYSNPYEGGPGYDPCPRPESLGGGRKQTTLVQDPDTGDLYATPPPDQAEDGDRTWEDVEGKIGTYHGDQPDGDDMSPAGGNRRDGDGKKKKKKKKKSKKNRKSVGQQDILSALSGKPSGGEDTSERGGGGADPHGDADDEIIDFDDEERKSKSKGEKRRKEGRRRKKKAAPPLSNMERVLDESAFDGIEDCDLRNAGHSDEALDYFLRSARSQRTLAWTVVFLDEVCTTPFLPTSRKYCTEKGPPCAMWNCTCDRQVRAAQAPEPVLCAMFVFPPAPTEREGGAGDEALPGPGEGGSGGAFGAGDEAQPGPADLGGDLGDLDCYLLPLGPTTTLDGDPPDTIEAGFERMANWPVAPFACGASLRRRWDGFRSILLDKHVTCVTYNAAVGLMPFHYHRTHDTKGGDVDLIVPSVWDLRLASWLLLPHSKEEQLEINAVRGGFPHLVRRLPDHGRPERPSKQLAGLLAARENLEFLLALHPILDRRISEKGIRSALDDIEGPLQSVLSAMECAGIGFVPSRLLGVQHQLERKIEDLTQEARAIAKDNTFLLSSPQQVSHLLFDIMQIKVPKGLSTKQVAGSQHRSTSEEALKAIKAEAKKRGVTIPIVEILLEFRTLNKMLTTYIRPLPNHARAVARPGCAASAKRRKRSKKVGGPGTSTSMRIHPMWMQTAVRTGRLSCRKPNMQQIPTDSVLGVNPRDSFTASESDRCLFACDYSQNEIRILAHMSNDETLIGMFHDRDEVDVYKQMSSACSGKPIESVTDEERRIYKQVTLAVLYGMGIPQVAKKLGVSRGTAQNFFDSFFGRFRGVRGWIERTKDFARRNHFVTTITGRRRYLDDIQSDDKGKRAQAERQAVNTIIQGSAADLMKLAMLKMSSRIMDWNKEGINAGGTDIPPKILLQIHDELLFEVMANEADVNRLKDAVMRCCSEECVQEFKIKVPLKLKCSAGMCWGSMQEIE